MCRPWLTPLLLLLLITSPVHGHASAALTHTSEFPLLGILGALGVSAGVASVLISTTALKVKSELDECEEKTAEFNNIKERCTTERDVCSASLAECVRDVEDLEAALPDLEERTAKLELLDRVCVVRTRLCFCGRITDENECDNQSDCTYTNNLQFCFPA